MRNQFVVDAYEELRMFYSQLYRFTVLPYTRDADDIFLSIASSVRRNGVNDCRIAAIAMAHGYTLVTANTRHYSKIPGLTFVDWTQE